MIRKGNIIRFKPEWQTPGDRYTYIAIEDEDGGRVGVTALGTGLPIPGWERVDASMLLPPEPSTDPAVVVVVAVHFCKVLHEWLGDAVLSEIARKNDAEPDPSICHTHDSCDANDAMAEAFHRAGFDRDAIILTPESLDPAPAEDSPEWEAAEKRQDTAIALWNAAWAQAKAARFRLDQPK